MALELIKNMSAKSWVSQRIWRTIGSLKKYASRLGMAEEDHNMNSNTSNPNTTTRNNNNGNGAMIRSQHSRFQTDGVGAGAGSPASSHGVYSPGPQTFSGGGGPFISQGNNPRGGAGAGAGAGGLASGASTPAPQLTQGLSPPDDQTNGLRLHTEMSRIFENMQGGLGVQRHAAGGGGGGLGLNRIHSPDGSMSLSGGAGGGGGGGHNLLMSPHHDVGIGAGGRASMGSPASSNGAGGVYQQLRDMF